LNALHGINLEGIQLPKRYQVRLSMENPIYSVHWGEQQKYTQNDGKPKPADNLWK
jgi:hypothetical protein